MKQFTLLVLVLLASFQMLQAQCVPDTTITDPGFYPSGSLPCAEQGVFIDTAIQLLNFTQINPADFGVPFPGLVDVNWIRIDDISGLPAGLSYECQPRPDSCIFLAGQHGCIRFFGTTTAAKGTYDLRIDATASAIIGGQTFEQPGTASDLGFEFSIDVISTGDPCPLPSVEVPTQPVFSCPNKGAIIRPVIDTGGAALPFTFAWSPAAGLDDSTLQYPTATVTVNTLYSLTVTDANGYAVETTAQVNFDNSPIPTADFSSTVTGNSVAFNNFSVDATSYVWNFGDGSLSFGESPTYLYNTTAATYDVMLIASSNCGSDTITKQVTINPVGINTVVKTDLGLTVSPNPSNGVFTLTINQANGAENYDVEIFALTGQRVFSEQVFGAEMDNKLIDLQKLNQGIYFLNVKNQSSMQTIKLVISE